MPDLGIGIGGSEAIGRYTRALGEVDVSLPPELHHVVAKETDRLIELARAKVLAEPAPGPKHTGLRAKIAEGVGVHEVISGDVQTLHITTSMPRRNMQSIPRGEDETAPGWVHPLFGNRRHWYDQHGAFSWFTQTFEDGRLPIESALKDVLQKARDRIAAA